MKQITIAENIRAYRKQKGLTQERLAEIMGVTVGAVSKWESGASVPDLTLIIELADFFETSVDVLLGYDWHGGGMGEAVERIKSLRNEKRFDEAATEAEKALERYPNSFDIAFTAAVMYSMRGVETSGAKSYRRALALFERSLELIGQNANEHVNEWSIRNNIASTYLALGQTDEALKRFKRNNADGQNNVAIGFTLAYQNGSSDEALTYLSNALSDSVSRRFQLVMGYVAAYRQKENYEAARAILTWMYADVSGLCEPNTVSYLDRMLCQLQSACAIIAAYAGDASAARRHLANAHALALRCDASPSYDFSGMRFLHGDAYHGFDSFGQTAKEGVQNVILNEKPLSDTLIPIWEELEHEKNGIESL